jgi:hypothetical protein
MLVPFTLDLAPIRRLLVVDFDGDPTWRSLEPQMLARPDGRLALVVLAYRHDGHVELYADPTLQVDPAGYRLGRGLRGTYPTVFEQARFEVTGEGLQVDVGFTALDGRTVAMHIHEHLAGRRDVFAALAPVGGSFVTPESFPFFWLPRMSFVPVRGTEVSLSIGGQGRRIRRLPIPLGGRRCLLARYDQDVVICRVNPDWVTDVPAVSATGDEPRRAGDMEVDVGDVHGSPGITAVRLRHGDHTCALELDPGVSDVARLPVSERCDGTVALSADGVVQLRGRYHIERHADHVDLSIDSISPWRTRPGRLVLALLFWLPVFRRWPTSYVWRARIDLAPRPTLTSGWERLPSRAAAAP